MKQRYVGETLLKVAASSRGRLVLLTGARQTGKSTLLKNIFPSYRYFALDDPEIRLAVTSLTPAQLVENYPLAIWDEIQKAPALIEKIKAAYDMSEKVRYILSGSSQILLLKQVQESLAGRIAIIELYPLTLPEIMTESNSISGFSGKSILMKLLDWCSSGQDLRSFVRTIDPLVLLNKQYPSLMRAWDSFSHWGGMPKLYEPEFSEEDRFQWLIDYNKTYLQRDLADLSHLDALEPFVAAQKMMSLRNGTIVNFSEMSRTIPVSMPTMKKFFRYLELSYQTIALNAWHNNPGKRLTKAPKIIFVDPGVCRSIIKRRGDIDGSEFESMVIAEIIKQCKSFSSPFDFYHMRTSDGREVDLLIETPECFIGVEIKMSWNARPDDCRHFSEIGSFLNKPLFGTLLLTNDTSLSYFEKTNTLAINVPFFLGAQ